MGTLFSSKRWGENMDPALYLSCEYQIGTRTDTSVQVRLKLTVSACPSGYYFGFNIRARAALAGSYMSDWVTIKGNTPSTWSTPYTTYFPSASGWYTVKQGVDNTSMTGAIYMDSNAGQRTYNYSGTVTFPKGNTPAYWPSSAGARFNYSGIVPENVDSVTCSWDAAKDDQNNPIQYKVDLYKNGTYQSTSQKGTTSQSFTLDTKNLNSGDSIYFKVYCKDDKTTSYPSTCKTSNTITWNTLKIASISKTSVSSIGYTTSSFTITRTNASNSNGDTGFTYTLSSPQLTVYNGNITSRGNPFTVQVWRSGTFPTGPYIKFADLQNYVKNTSYKGNIGFQITTANDYGSSDKSGSFSVAVDLQRAPTASSITQVSGKTTVNGEDYFVINRKPITIVWGKSTDDNGAAVSYTLQESIDGGSFSDVASGLTATSYNYPVRSITSSQTVKFRVISKTSYGTTTTGPASGEHVLHYFNPPVISGLKIDRSADKYTLKWKYEQSSSIGNVLRRAVFTLKDSDTGEDLSTVTGGSATEGSASYDMSLTISGLEETTTYPFCLECSDTIASVFGLTPASVFGVIPRYSALLSIREKGVGIHSVAGDFADFSTKGTVSMYGGEPDESGSGLADGSINLAVGKDSPLNIYVGCYVDSQGVLRSSYNTEANAAKCFRQVQAYFNGAAQVPLRHRWIEPAGGAAVAKDAEIPDPVYSSWMDYVDATGIYTPSGAPIIDTSKAGNAGGVGIGKVWSQGALDVNGDIYQNGKKLIDLIYPINSVYISYSHTSPSSLFGGSWTRITSTFLWAVSGDTSTIGYKDGEKEHTLTANEMPAHSHTEYIAYNGGATTVYAYNGPSNLSVFDYSKSAGVRTSSSGGGQAHNNMPPYIQVSVWRRTA